MLSGVVLKTAYGMKWEAAVIWSKPFGSLWGSDIYQVLLHLLLFSNQRWLIPSRWIIAELVAALEKILF